MNLSRLAVVGVGLLAIVVAGCATPQGTRVELKYDVADASPRACAKTVGVTWFDDDTGSESLGMDGETEIYSRSKAVSTWVTDALVRELVARGCKARIWEDGSEYEPEVFVGGSVRDVDLKRTGDAYELKLVFRVEMETEARRVYRQEYEGRWERTAEPADKVFSEMLSQGLAELMAKAAEDAADHLR